MITASSQLEISSSSPFGCAPRDRCIPNHSFQNNLKDLVTSCISGDNSHHIDYTDLWVHHPQRQASNNNNNINNTERDHDLNEGYKHNNNITNDSGAKVISHHHKDKWARSNETVFSGSSTAISSNNSPTQSEKSVEIPSLVGVSSLVQKWRDFEVEAKCSSRRNLGITFLDNSVGPAPVTNEEDAFGDWESDRTTASGPPSSRGRDSDATESDRLRVADIIRKLTDDRAGCDSLAHVRTPLDQSEQRCFSPVVNSPRIRGRQAFHDLLVQMERERHKELQGLEACKAVSKYSQRGRIQALLRVKFFRRGMDAREGKYSNVTPSDSNKLNQSAIMLIRERFNSRVPNTSIQSGNSFREMADATSVVENLYISNQQEKDNQHEEVASSESTPRVGTDDIQTAEGSITSKEHFVDHDSHESNENVQNPQNASPTPTFMWQNTSCDDNNCRLLESAEKSTLLHNIEINMHPEAEGTTNLQVTEANHDLTGDRTHSQSDLETEECNDQHSMGSTLYLVSEVSHPDVGWDELLCDYPQQEGNSSDWICKVSRPRSDWEGLRQARYQEMLDPFSDKEDIRLLLARRNVSTFLSSGLKEQIDRVMMSRAEGQLNLKNNHTQEEEEEEEEEEQVLEVKARDKDKEVITSDDGEVEDEGEDEQDEERDDYGDYFDEYEETESSIGQQFNESDDYLDRPTSLPTPSWPLRQGHEASDYSYPVTSPSPQKSLSSNSYSQDNRANSFTTAHSSNEMELLYDLKGHMEQLHQEISVLRRSIKCCMNMQMKLQRSIGHKVSITPSHSDEKKGQQNSVSCHTSSGRCCICCEMQVDSLLYRCGHMCTCFKCAHKLQQGSGKCPICSASIMDVVRTNSHF